MATQLHIAIDGPVAAGKGTVASRVAQKLGILYVETGAMYRAVALLGMREHIELHNATALLALLQTHTLTLTVSKETPGTCQVYLDDEDVTEKIRTPEVSQGSSVVATIPEIREYLVKKQQEIATGESVVMEGRDIGTVVLPDAQVKVFLTADPTIRAKRRQSQQAEKGITQSFEEILEETKKRDTLDTQRAINPLQVSQGATIIDTTKLTIDQVVETIINLSDHDPHKN